MILYIGNNIKSSNTTVLVQLSNLLKKEGLNVIISSSKENQLFRLIEMLYSVLKWNRRIDYVLIDTYSTKNFYYAFLVSQLCRFLHLKYIPILHGGNLPNRLKNSPQWSRLIFKNSYSNIAPSYYLKEAFEKEGYNVKFIPNNLEINQYTFKKRKKLTPNLLFVRSFSDIYNPELAVKVLHELKKEYPSAKLCMVGPDKDGSLQKCKDLAHKYGIKDSIAFTGKLSKTEWHELSIDYDIFINPTNFDNTPVSVMEAMALGLPIVSTNVGGIPFLLKDNTDALLVNKDSVGEMTEAIISLLKTPSKSLTLLINARKKVEQFDWEIIKHDWLSILAR